jgi:hypothetical protein
VNDRSKVISVQRAKGFITYLAGHITVERKSMNPPENAGFVQRMRHGRRDGGGRKSSAAGRRETAGIYTGRRLT